MPELKTKHSIACPVSPAGSVKRCYREVAEDDWHEGQANAAISVFPGRRVMTSAGYFSDPDRLMMQAIIPIREVALSDCSSDEAPANLKDRRRMKVVQSAD